MNVKKLLELSEEEFDVLIAAGDLLTQIGKSLETGEADALSDGAKRITEALFKTLDAIKAGNQE